MIISNWCVYINVFFAFLNLLILSLKHIFFTIMYTYFHGIVIIIMLCAEWAKEQMGGTEQYASGSGAPDQGKWPKLELSFGKVGDGKIKFFYHNKDRTLYRTLLVKNFQNWIFIPSPTLLQISTNSQKQIFQNLYQSIEKCWNYNMAKK